MSDYYEGRIASLRTGIELVIQTIGPSLLSAEAKVEIAEKSLQALLDSDLDKSLSPTEGTAVSD